MLSTEEVEVQFCTSILILASFLLFFSHFFDTMASKKSALICFCRRKQNVFDLKEDY